LHVGRVGISLMESRPLRHVGAQTTAARLVSKLDNDRRGNQRPIRVAVLCRDNREGREVAPRRPVVGIRGRADRRNTVCVAGRDIGQEATDRCHDLNVARLMPEIKTELTLFQTQNRPIRAGLACWVKICVTLWDSD